MAEYYPLLAKAVAGRHNAPVADRQVIYDRARQALLGQLRSMNVPAEAIDRESTSLDEAIARVEAEVASSMVAPASAEPATAVPSVATQPRPAPAPPAPKPPPRPAPIVSRPITAPPVAPTPSVRPPRPAAEALSRIVAERVPVPPEVKVPPREEPEAPAEAPRSAPPLPSAPTLQVPSFTDILDATAVGEAEAESGKAPASSTPSAPEESVRPRAPHPITRKRFNPRFLILTMVGALVVAGIAYAAWRLRDRPDALARTRAAMLAAQQAEDQQTAKVSTRAETPPAGVKMNPAVVPPPPTPEPAPAPTAVPVATTGVETIAPPQAAASGTPAATPAPAASPDAPAADGTAAPATGDPALPVTQRAAFLVDAPNDPQKVKTYVGTVIWSAGSSNPAQNQPISQTVRAEISVPEAAMQLSMVLQKNFEAQFPASHTLEFHFTLDPGNTIGPIKQINAPQMRQDSAPAGDALLGLPVTITENYFLVGLSRGDATAHNLELIRSRNWFDVPILLASGRVAKVTFEKGTTGTAIVDSVLQSWQ